jgi:hypothetical protein
MTISDRKQEVKPYRKLYFSISGRVGRFRGVKMTFFSPGCIRLLSVYSRKRLISGGETFAYQSSQYLRGNKEIFAAGFEPIDSWKKLVRLRSFRKASL